MAGGEAANDVPRDEDYGTAKMRDEDWWFESVEKFLAEVRRFPPPRLLVDLANAPVLDEKFVAKASHIKGFLRAA